MKPLNLKYQGGVALIIFVLMLMGIGGILFVGYSQGLLKQVELSRTEHNTRVLNEAKQALLQFAYNYPVLSTPSIGPGRLPNADTDNDGIADGGSTFGRLPWAQADLNLYDIRDADGERLWYAVSSTFRPQAVIVNSDTSGNLTLRDQQGNVIYDGSNPGGLAQYGIAAVIIAPGAVTARDGTSQDRSIANVDNPVHYLDLVFGIEDNATRILGDPTDGFILGPVDTLSTDAVNDQFIVITAAEVIAMAEKATLQAYQTAINKYLVQTGNVYPWMNAYADILDLTIYDVVPGGAVSRAGRVPFLNYYMDHDSHTVITDLVINYEFTWLSIADSADGNDPTYIDAFRVPANAFFANPQPLDISRSSLSFEKIKFDGSDNVDTDDFGILISGTDGSSVVNSASSYSKTLYFWDGCSDCDELTENGWEECPVVYGDERDCAIDEDYDADAEEDGDPVDFENFTSWPDHAEIQIMMIELQFTLDSEFVVEFDYSIARTTNPPTAPTGVANSRFTTVHNPLSVTQIAIADSSFSDDIAFVDISIVQCEGDGKVGVEYNTPSSNPNSGSFYCNPDISAAVTITQFDITSDYYPELPMWVSQNNWNNSILMAYADEYRPGVVTSSCTPENGDTSTGAADDCILVNNEGGINNNIVSLLVIAGENDFVDGDDLNNDGDWDDIGEGGDGVFSNDLHDIFEPENYSGIGLHPGLRLVFDKREPPVDGNFTDTILILDSL